MKGNFIILEKESLEKFEEANNLGIFKHLSPKITETDKKRIGFYFLVLEILTGIDDLETISNMIIDTEYTHLTQGTPNKADLGADAYYIEEGDKENVINIFSFKYRESYGSSKGQFKQNEACVTKRFLDNIPGDRNNSKTLEDDPSYDNVFAAIRKIRKILNAPKDAVKKLYFVSNEAGRPREGAFDACRFNESYEVLNSKDLVNRLAKISKDARALFQVSEKHTISYKEEDEESVKLKKGELGNSFVFVVSLYDLVRITCNDQCFRKDITLRDPSVKSSCIKKPLSPEELLKKFTIDEDLLGDNVRKYLGHTKYNKDIVDTLAEKKNEYNFFAYNNGVTIIADSVVAKKNNDSSIYTVRLNKFQIVNGGQTLNSIYEYIQTCKDPADKVLEVLDNNFVLMRAYSVGVISPDDKENEESLGTKIARYTNSQNAIKPADLRANNNIQISLHYYLKDSKYYYVRKSGETNIPNGYKAVSMELVAQILMAIMQGEPGKASNNKRSLFEKEYKSIFENDLDFRSVKEYIDFYFVVSDYYENKKIKSIQRKLYTIYVGNKFKVGGLQIKTINDLEDFLDSRVQKYIHKKNEEEGKKNEEEGKKNEEEGKNGGVGRKINYRVLISKGFKEFLDSEIEAEINKEKK
uniref:AIPR family protein n=1 Tax=uncultured Rothia sp. TaxID=316088 RepID=UPI0025F7AF32|nr:AIPR family protein [uncultured Rothia sp.]